MAEVEEVVKENEVGKEIDLEAKIRASLEVEYQKRLEDQVVEISKQLTEQNKKTVQEALDGFRKELVPPTNEEVKKLLDQEYAEVSFEIRAGTKDGVPVKRTFVIRELPQAVERRMYKKIKEILVPYSADLAAVSMNLMEGSAEKKIVQMMNTFEPMLDVMVAICAIALNPYGEEEDVDGKWVEEHLSSVRIAKIVTAQVQCNKIRDFFSLLFQGSRLVM
jgi:hypothetical protein